MTKLERVAAGLAVLLAVLLEGCGVPLDNKPEEIPDQPQSPDVEAPPGTASPMTVPGEQAVTVQLFFVRGDRLAPVAREIPGPVSLASVLNQILAGPAAHEKGSGIRSAISPLTRIRRALLHDGVATVDLSAPFGDVQGEEQIAALAQIVFSCTALPGVERVRFHLEGRPVEVPTGDGHLTLRPLTRADFLALAPP